MTLLTEHRQLTPPSTPQAVEKGDFEVISSHPEQTLEFGKNGASQPVGLIGLNDSNGVHVYGPPSEPHRTNGVNYMNTARAVPVLFEQNTTNPDLVASTFDHAGFLRHLHLQGGLVDDGRDRHPDLGIAQLCKGLATFLVEDNSDQFAHLIENLSRSRHLDSGHLVDLIARVIQYIFRSKDDASYVNFSAEDWQQYFATLDQDTLERIYQLCSELNVSTHVLTRYRGLAALMDITAAQRTNESIVVDIGCSANLGLATVLTAENMNAVIPPLTHDATPGTIFARQSTRTLHNGSRGIGLDVDTITDEWAAACAYYAQYDTTAQGYKAAKKAISASNIQPETWVADISDPSIVDRILQSTGQVDCFHASMVFYQLSPEQFQAALKNIEQLLKNGGFLIELTFVDPTNWFKPDNVQTLVRIMRADGRLSEPLQWLIWNNSRCTQVKPGVDYKQVMQLLTVDEHI